MNKPNFLNASNNEKSLPDSDDQKERPAKRRGKFVSSLIVSISVVYLLSFLPLSILYDRNPEWLPMAIGLLLIISVISAVIIWIGRKDNPSPISTDPSITFQGAFSDIYTTIREVGIFFGSFLKALPIIIGVLVVLAIIIGLIVVLFANAPWWAAVIILLLVMIVLR